MGGNLGEAAVQAVEAAREVAQEIGVSEQQAISRAIDDANKTAEAIGTEAAKDVRDALAQYAEQA